MALSVGAGVGAATSSQAGSATLRAAGAMTGGAGGAVGDLLRTAQRGGSRGKDAQHDAKVADRHVKEAGYDIDSIDRIKRQHAQHSSNLAQRRGFNPSEPGQQPDVSDSERMTVTCATCRDFSSAGLKIAALEIEVTNQQQAADRASRDAARQAKLAEMKAEEEALAKQPGSYCLDARGGRRGLHASRSGRRAYLPGSSELDAAAVSDGTGQPDRP
ncbi:MAG: hypothetical protein U0263_24510 [Polyangiaceae bacterium]